MAFIHAPSQGRLKGLASWLLPVTLSLPALVFAADDSILLHQIFKDDWAWRIHEYPESATLNGYSDGNDRWTDLSVEAIGRRKQHVHDNLKALDAIHPGVLTPEDRLNYDLFRRETLDAVTSDRFPYEFLRMDPLFNGVHREIPNLLRVTPKSKPRDYEDMLARLRRAPELIDQNIALLKLGLEKGITPPKITMQGIPAQFDSILTSDPSKSPLLTPFDHAPEALRKSAAAQVDGPVYASYRKLRDFLVTEYIPKCRETIARSALPDGAAWYAFDLLGHTTTAYTPEQIHQIGQREVKRIHAEMDRVIQGTGFKGDFAAFVTYLRTDPKFYYTRPEDLLTGYRDFCKRVDPELPRLFSKLPRQPYGVVEIPLQDAPQQTTAYYQPGAIDGSRAGNFYANTYKLESRPKYEMEALALHESVPGHHLQIALAYEIEDMPEFRKVGYVTAFVEGWGLYAESLGTELGFYKDPYSRFGQLSYEMWRACRLVVDTGMHSLGWTRQQAIDFMKANTSLTEQNIVSEVDRYISWPGQATAYKLGELKIKELRAFSEKALGEKFKIREFHDLVLGAGPLPLDILEQRVKDWVSRQKG